MKKISVCILALLILMPLIVAVNINVKTLPEHKMHIIIREAGKLSNIDSYYPETGSGEVTVSPSLSVSEIDILVKLTKDGETIINKKFESISTSSPININFMSEEEAEIVDSFEEPEEEVEEESEEKNEEVENQTGDNESGEVNETQIEKETNQSRVIIGAAISDIKSFFSSKITYYVIGGIFIVGVLFFIVFIVKKKISSKDSPKIIKLSERGYDKKLSDAEEKLEQARKELDFLKNRKKRLEEARERFKRDQEELEKLEKRY